MSTRFTYHGAASFEIVGPTHRVLIDPFLSQNPLAPCAPADPQLPRAADAISKPAMTATPLRPRHPGRACPSSIP